MTYIGGGGVGLGQGGSGGNARKEREGAAASVAEQVRVRARMPRRSGGKELWWEGESKQEMRGKRCRFGKGKELGFILS